MSQLVIYKGIVVQPVEGSSGKIRIQTTNPGDANKAGIPFKDMVDGAAVFETWVAEDQLVPVDP